MSIKKKVWNVVKNILIFIVIVIFFSCFWTIDNFGLNVSFEQIIFHAKAGVEGTDIDIYLSFILCCVVPALVVVLLLMFVPKFIDAKFSKKEGYLKKKSVIKKIANITLIVILILTLVYSVFIYRIPRYIKNCIVNSTFIEEHYVDPQDVQITDNGQKRNLIFVYMESMESTYYSKEYGGYEDENLMPNLAKLAEENISFSTTDKFNGAYQLENTQWTIASMTANYTGVPLKVPFSRNRYGENSSFLPGAYTLQNILHDKGYYQEVVMGSDKEFSGLDVFYMSHGCDKIFDDKYAKSQGLLPSNYHVFWGMEDEKVFKFAKDEILEASKKDEPFAFTVVTMDTHSPNGYKCKLCEDKYDSQYANVIACSDKQVSEFVEWCKQQDFYENTTIILIGDHTSMANEFFENMDDSYRRSTVNIIINSAVTTENTKNRVFTYCDMFPTILASMGYNIEGEHLGLGFNLFSDVPTLSEQYGFDYMNEKCEMRTKYYENHLMYDNDK